MIRPRRSAVALRHLAFEDLGLLSPVMEREGWDVSFCEAAVEDLKHPSIRGADLVVVLGGPIGVYQTDDYPFLTAEIALIEYRLSRNLPTLGICLGSQLMAKALGGRIYKGPVKEIGWGKVELTREGVSSCLGDLRDEDAMVLHWHGDGSIFLRAPSGSPQTKITRTRRSPMATTRWRFNFTWNPIHDSSRSGMSAIPSNWRPRKSPLQS